MTELPENTEQRFGGVHAIEFDQMAKTLLAAAQGRLFQGVLLDYGLGEIVLGSSERHRTNKNSQLQKHH
jgi:hypothetical protein